MWTIGNLFEYIRIHLLNEIERIFGFLSPSFIHLWSLLHKIKLQLIATSNYPRLLIARQIPFLHPYLFPPPSLLPSNMQPTRSNTNHADYDWIVATRDEYMNINGDLRRQLQQLTANMAHLRASRALIGEQLTESHVHIEELTSRIIEVENELGASRTELFAVRDRLARFQELQILYARHQVRAQLLACWHPPTGTTALQLLEEHPVESTEEPQTTNDHEEELDSENEAEVLREERDVSHDVDETIHHTSPVSSPSQWSLPRTSYRDLTLQLEQVRENEDGEQRFYQMALQRLKQEQEQRRQQTLVHSSQRDETSSQEWHHQVIRRLHQDRILRRSPCFQPRPGHPILVETSPTNSSTSTLSFADDQDINHPEFPELWLL